jgi:hypothetical protein
VKSLDGACFWSCSLWSVVAWHVGADVGIRNEE